MRLARAQLITCFSLVYFIVEPNSLKTCDREVLPWRGHAERRMVAFVKHDYQFGLNLPAVAFLPRLVHLKKKTKRIFDFKESSSVIMIKQECSEIFDCSLFGPLLLFYLFRYVVCGGGGGGRIDALA